MVDLSRGMPSPCNQVCVLNAEQVCIGCGRSSDEIGRWSLATVDEQIGIIEQAGQRLKELQETGNGTGDTH